MPSPKRSTAARGDRAPSGGRSPPPLASCPRRLAVRSRDSLKRGVGGSARKQWLQQLQQRILAQAVVREGAAPLALNEPGIAQNPQVIADRGLGERKQAHQVTDADRPLPGAEQPMDDLHPRRVSKRGKARCKRGGKILLERRRRRRQLALLLTLLRGEIATALIADHVLLLAADRISRYFNIEVSL